LPKDLIDRVNAGDFDFDLHRKKLDELRRNLEQAEKMKYFRNQAVIDEFKRQIQSNQEIGQKALVIPVLEILKLISEEQKESIILEYFQSKDIKEQILSSTEDFFENADDDVKALYGYDEASKLPRELVLGDVEANTSSDEELKQEASDWLKEQINRPISTIGKDFEVVFNDRLNLLMKEAVAAGLTEEEAKNKTIEYLKELSLSQRPEIQQCIINIVKKLEDVQKDEIIEKPDQPQRFEEIKAEMEQGVKQEQVSEIKNELVEKSTNKIEKISVAPEAEFDDSINKILDKDSGLDRNEKLNALIRLKKSLGIELDRINNQIVSHRQLITDTRAHLGLPEENNGTGNESFEMAQLMKMGAIVDGRLQKVEDYITKEYVQEKNEEEKIKEQSKFKQELDFFSKEIRNLLNVSRSREQDKLNQIISDEGLSAIHSASSFFYDSLGSTEIDPAEMQRAFNALYFGLDEIGRAENRGNMRDNVESLYYMNSVLRKIEVGIHTIRKYISTESKYSSSLNILRGIEGDIIPKKITYLSQRISLIEGYRR
jgi:hypothetical protein